MENIINIFVYTYFVGVFAFLSSSIFLYYFFILLCIFFSIRDENVPNNDWDGHHRDVEHGRDRGYPTVEWEEKDWRTRTMWESRDSLPRTEIHDEDWNSRYDNSVTDWKSNDTRKWDNQNVHVRSHYRNDRSKNLNMGESAQHR